ncbi:MAG: hypothetical protein DI498_02885 [Paracoccus denitrificans]|nr:MAG: hypothetical protein DI498_02885 [Paracoccus denitrificans]PZO85486.1 MAG: hypothetical protein DI633_02885 [Paracoccus denitrificans]
MVFGIRPNFTPDSAYGYAFDGDEGRPIALSVDLIALKQPVQEYLQSVYKAGQKAPVKILVQFNDETGEYNIDFEDEDVDRWKVSPRNLDLIREELRPGF